NTLSADRARAPVNVSAFYSNDSKARIESSCRYSAGSRRRPLYSRCCRTCREPDPSTRSGVSSKTTGSVVSLPTLPDRGLLADVARETAKRDGVQAWAAEKDFYITRLI